jgi:hypothetical protein
MGLSCGVVLHGNIGSENRMEWGLIGDEVRRGRGVVRVGCLILVTLGTGESGRGGGGRAGWPSRDHTGKLASLNRSWQSKEGTYCALGMAGIEPTPSSPSQNVTGPRFRLNHSAKEVVP